MTDQETVLITGGTSVVGQAIIPALIEQGYRVVYTSRKQDHQIGGATCLQADLLEDNGAEINVPRCVGNQLAVYLHFDVRTRLNIREPLGANTISNHELIGIVGKLHRQRIAHDRKYTEVFPADTLVQQVVRLKFLIRARGSGTSA